MRRSERPQKLFLFPTIFHISRTDFAVGRFSQVYNLGVVRCWNYAVGCASGWRCSDLQSAFKIMFSIFFNVLIDIFNKIYIEPFDSIAQLILHN